MFNNLTKLMKILTRENSMKNFYFILVGAQVILRILVKAKNLGQFKKLL